MSDTRTKVVPLEAEPEQWQAAFDLFNGQYHEDQMQSQIICIQEMYKAMVAAAPAFTHAMPKSEGKPVNTESLVDKIFGAIDVMVMGTRDVKSAIRRVLNEELSTPQPSTDVSELVRKAALYDAINTPEIDEFLSAVRNEALHQRERWGSEHDAGKTDADWFWLVGHLASKALLKTDKSIHHIITTAAALLNWHAAKVGAHTLMRPGIGPDAQPPKPSTPLNDLGDMS